MSYTEYLDLHLRAQNNPNALYHVISFDVVKSKQMNKEKRANLQKNIHIIVQYVYNKLLEKQQELNMQIVLTDERFIRPWDSKKKLNSGIFIDPFIFGDCFEFTILRNTIPKEEIIKWVYECKNKLNMEEDFYIADGYYETNEYEEGKTLYYRGYCLQTLETLHKKQLKEKLKKIK